MSELEEIGKIASSGAADKLMELVLKGLGPSVEQFGLIGGDFVRELRWNNIRRILARAQKKLEQAGRLPKPIPLRLLLPILESASVEDENVLQDMWAGLLATASQETDRLSPSFAETLRQLTPNETRFFDKFYRNLQRKNQKAHALRTKMNPLQFRADAPEDISAETFERLGLLNREYGLTDGEYVGEKEVGYLLALTEYAQRFMRACLGEFHADSDTR